MAKAATINSIKSQQTSPKTTTAKGGGKQPKKKKGKSKSELRAELKSVSGIESRKEFIKLALASVLLIVTVFLYVALISNIFTSADDQAGVLDGSLVDASNYAGALGAYVSYYLMNQLFGLGMLMLPVFTTCMVFKMMMKACPLRVWVVFVHCTIIAILVSIDASFVACSIPSGWCDSFAFEPGGMHGREVVNVCMTYVGPIITFIILACFTIGYVGYWFTQVFIMIFKGFQKIGRLIFPPKQEVEGAFEGECLDETDNEMEDCPSDGEDMEESSDSENGDQEIELEISENEENNDVRPNTLEDLEETGGEETNESTENEAVVEQSAEAAEVDFVITNNDSIELNEKADDRIVLGISETSEEQVAGTKTVESISEDLTPYDPKLDLERYKYPPVNLLVKHASSGNPTSPEELEENKDRIIQVLRNFSVEITKITATVGPTVTLYEITPAPGVRIAKIRTLEDDIALSLSALGIRIIAPIPGKGTIGIEVPNQRPQVVSMESIINTQKFRETKYELPIALGKTITNEMFMVDLAKMPHLLVAGATGQGKSVGLNAIITSLLYKKHPSELKLVMIDPKKVEFSMYNPIINHFLAQVPDSDEPVITDVKKVITTLKSLCQEMDERYDLLKIARCRNIKEYNAKFCERHLSPSNGHKYLPYIVVIIDEFGDLIMTAGKEIELPIARIAQLARAVGIHMVIATQSPRATIITGKIKANFPARMAFRVSQGIESQTILDRRGANNLIGRGDMLFQAGSDLTRVQCAFVDTPEVVAIAKFIESQQAYPSPFELPLVSENEGDGMEGISSSDGTSTFEQVARFVVNTQQGSTSKIQRNFSVGFNRAGRLMDQLEEAGIVGPQMGSKPREVLVHSEIDLQQILTALREAGHKFE